LSCLVSQLYRFCGGATNIETAQWTFHSPETSKGKEEYALMQNFSIATPQLSFLFRSDVSSTFAGFELAYDFSMLYMTLSQYFLHHVFFILLRVFALHFRSVRSLFRGSPQYHRRATGQHFALVQ
jgi:hypothetical protein